MCAVTGAVGDTANDDKRDIAEPQVPTTAPSISVASGKLAVASEGSSNSSQFYRRRRRCRSGVTFRPQFEGRIVLTDIDFIPCLIEDINGAADQFFHDLLRGFALVIAVDRRIHVQLQQRPPRIVEVVGNDPLVRQWQNGPDRRPRSLDVVVAEEAGRLSRIPALRVELLAMTIDDLLLVFSWVSPSKATMKAVPTQTPMAPKESTSSSPPIRDTARGHSRDGRHHVDHLWDEREAAIFPV